MTFRIALFYYQKPNYRIKVNLLLNQLLKYRRSDIVSYSIDSYGSMKSEKKSKYHKALKYIKPLK